MRVEILADSTREITSRKNNETKQHRFQECFIWFTGEKYPRPATVYVQPDKPFYLPGDYELDIEKSLRIRNDRLEFDQLVLKTIKVDNSNGGPRVPPPSSVKN